MIDDKFKLNLFPILFETTYTYDSKVLDSVQQSENITDLEINKLLKNSAEIPNNRKIQICEKLIDKIFETYTPEGVMNILLNQCKLRYFDAEKIIEYEKERQQ